MATKEPEVKVCRGSAKRKAIKEFANSNGKKKRAHVYGGNCRQA
jgi:hypothetical protein